MSHTHHYALIIAALVFTWGDWKAFALSIVVGIGIIIPVPLPAITWYLACASGEILIAALAFRLKTRASYFIATMSIMLLAYHLIGWWFDGYPANSPYRPLVKILEYAQIIACSIFSKPILRLLKNAARIHH